jgi:hypothetical protein
MFAPLCLLQPIKVDNAGQTAAKLIEIFGNDVTIKQDPWHCIMRICRTVNPHHPAYESFRSQVSRAIFTLHAPDVKALMPGHFSEDDDSPDITSLTPAEQLEVIKKARKFIGAGQEVYDRLEAVVQQFEQKTTDFINQDTKDALHNQQDLIVKGYLTGGHKQDRHSHDPCSMAA